MIDGSQSVPPTADYGEPAVFDAVLYPNRSLGPRGFALLMGAIVAISSLIGIGFALVGAWPVTGFLGLDILFLYLAFRWNFRDARRADFIRLDRNGLMIRRVSPENGTREWHFDLAWVQVILEDRRLKLRSHGKDLEIGSCLTADERMTFAEALRSALHAHRAAPL